MGDQLRIIHFIYEPINLIIKLYEFKGEKFTASKSIILDYRDQKGQSSPYILPIVNLKLFPF